MTVILDNFPPVVDDTGTGKDGTIFNEAFFDLVQDSLEGYLVSPSNPGVKAATIIDEVVEARGSMPSLDDRLDVLLNEDGTPKISAIQAVVPSVRNGGFVNGVRNDRFDIWSAGDAVAPDYWSVTGGPTIDRSGLLQADTTTKHTAFSAKITSQAGTAATLQQDVAVVGLGGLITPKRQVVIGARVKTTTPEAVRLAFFDGVLTSFSDYHTGSATGGPEADGWEWLFIVHTLAPTATLCRLRMDVPAGTVTAYISGPIFGLGDQAPTDWVPCLMSFQHYECFIAGNNAAANGKYYWTSPGRAFLEEVNLTCETAGTVGASSWDIKGRIGAAWVSLIQGGAGFTLAAGSFSGGGLFAVSPSASFRRSNLAVPLLGAVLSDNGHLRFDCLADDAGNTTADVRVRIKWRMYASPYAQFD